MVPPRIRLVESNQNQPNLLYFPLNSPYLPSLKYNTNQMKLFSPYQKNKQTKTINALTNLTLLTLRISFLTSTQIQQQNRLQCAGKPLDLLCQQSAENIMGRQGLGCEAVPPLMFTKP